MTYADAFNLRTTNVSFNNVADAIDGSFGRSWGGTTTGSSTAFACTASPAWTALTTGEEIAILPHTANTGASTLNVNSLGTINIFYMGFALVGGEMRSGTISILRYDGTRFNLLNHAGGWATWTPTYGATGSMTYTTVSTNVGNYQRHGTMIIFNLTATGTTGGTAANTITFTPPVNLSGSTPGFGGYVADGGGEIGATAFFSAPGTVNVKKYDASNFGLGASRQISISGFYKV
jgi:hypothetical protein